MYKTAEVIWEFTLNPMQNLWVKNNNLGIVSCESGCKKCPKFFVMSECISCILVPQLSSRYEGIDLYYSPSQYPEFSD